MYYLFLIVCDFIRCFWHPKTRARDLNVVVFRLRLHDEITLIITNSETRKDVLVSKESVEKGLRSAVDDWRRGSGLVRGGGRGIFVCLCCYCNNVLPARDLFTTGSDWTEPNQVTGPTTSWAGQPATLTGQGQELAFLFPGLVLLLMCHWAGPSATYY